MEADGTLVYMHILAFVKSLSTANGGLPLISQMLTASKSKLFKAPGA